MLFRSLRFADFSRATRSYTLPHPTGDTQAILDALRGLLGAAAPTIERRGLTLIGVSIANLDDGRSIQLSLPLDGYPGGSLDAALDEVRERFGAKAVMRAVLLGRDEGFSPPLLPD